MSETKFTPGPWRPSPTVPGGRFGAVVSEHPVPGIRGSDVVEYYGGHLIAESVAPQNLALISCAPELYEALAWFVDYLPFGVDPRHSGDEMDRRVRLAEAILQRARGETP